VKRSWSGRPSRGRAGTKRTTTHLILLSIVQPPHVRRASASHTAFMVTTSGSWRFGWENCLHRMSRMVEAGRASSAASGGAYSHRTIGTLPRSTIRRDCASAPTAIALVRVAGYLLDPLTNSNATAKNDLQSIIAALVLISGTSDRMSAGAAWIRIS